MVKKRSALGSNPLNETKGVDLLIQDTSGKTLQELKARELSMAIMRKAAAKARVTYSMEKTIIKAVKVYGALEGMEQSTIVSQAIKEYLASKGAKV